MDINEKVKKVLAYKEYIEKSQADVKKSKLKYKQSEDQKKELIE
jgi:hypothetical protein